MIVIVTLSPTRVMDLAVTPGKPAVAALIPGNNSSTAFM
jgi:hypothetical protein